MSVLHRVSRCETRVMVMDVHILERLFWPHETRFYVRNSIKLMTNWLFLALSNLILHNFEKNTSCRGSTWAWEPAASEPMCAKISNGIAKKKQLIKDFFSNVASKCFVVLLFGNCARMTAMMWNNAARGGFQIKMSKKYYANFQKVL